MKKMKNLAITTVAFVAMYKAFECYELLMMANLKATLTFVGCVFILWVFWRVNYEEQID